MKQYHLYTVVPRLTKFIDQLTNWYVRLNRRRIKGELGKDQCIKSLDTLYDVLYSMVQMMAPFTPFLSEYIFQRLLLFQPVNAVANPTSVHYQLMPVCNRNFIRSDIEKSVSLMQSVIELGRVMRDRRTLPIKYPVSDIIVIYKDEDSLSAIKSLETFILSELNVRKLTVSSDKEKYGITSRAEPDHKVLGQRLKGNFKSTISAMKQLKDGEIQLHLSNGYFEIVNQRIELEEVRIIYCVSEKIGANMEANSDNEVLVLMDMTPSPELLEEGLAREFINRIQKLKKKAQLIPTDPVVIFYKLTENFGESHQLSKIIGKHESMIKASIKSELLPFSMEETAKRRVIITENTDIKGVNIELTICTNGNENATPFKWVNFILSEKISPRFNQGRKASILLENSTTNKFITLSQIYDEINTIFGLFGLNYSIYSINNRKKIEASDVNISLNGETLLVGFALNETAEYQAVKQSHVPFCHFKNMNHFIFTENPQGNPLL